ncbi:MAG: helix-turn-helix domain-containing protein [Firmicutes bacterium]|uniref:Helix-turn-helix domain-containing protein n=1 Tax=Kroppenstedtia guangzhouensis TaxID=1274356 RepID=A0ABQ1GN27_9BACL|nr:helix-turn-helix domain-containing protein [Kroppenstedtia guangzhouensis]EGK10199.1 hypothetical protein HMPREF9374_2549 [Desmospora sp. 8437]MDA8353629.1 helix-turn-helix domain-containing protein [Bacillota bacterium]TMZ63883.1 DNA-binding protein [Klebsiella pneumoniae]GGA46879.1 hypothetical protein GCM10007416_20070 [Kroppenstedtia guangzhouensis]
MSAPFALIQAQEEADFRISAKDIVRLLTALQQNQLPEVLHVDDVERILRVSHYTALELMKKKEFPSLKLGRSHKIPRDEFLRWLSESAQSKAMISIT